MFKSRMAPLLIAISATCAAPALAISDHTDPQITLTDEAWIALGRGEVYLETDANTFELEVIRGYSLTINFAGLNDEPKHIRLDGKETFTFEHLGSLIIIRQHKNIEFPGTIPTGQNAGLLTIQTTSGQLYQIHLVTTNDVAKSTIIDLRPKGQPLPVDSDLVARGEAPFVGGPVETPEPFPELPPPPPQTAPPLPPQTETVPEAEAAPQTEAEAAPQTETVPEAEAEAAPQTEAEAAPQTETVPEAEAEAAPQTEAETSPEVLEGPTAAELRQRRRQIKEQRRKIRQEKLARAREQRRLAKEKRRLEKAKQKQARRSAKDQKRRDRLRKKAKKEGANEQIVQAPTEHQNTQKPKGQGTDRQHQVALVSDASRTQMGEEHTAMMTPIEMAHAIRRGLITAKAKREITYSRRRGSAYARMQTLIGLLLKEIPWDKAVEKAKLSPKFAADIREYGQKEND